ncbi:MAG: Ig-like domain-containing protein [Oscillospiraceae bacterium]|nr:Ig-like domain-containing protein [Oscillospiraceae bacterium]
MEYNRELIKCPQCGERYSSSYASCPFCEEDGEPEGARSNRRHVADHHAGQSARGGLIMVLVLVLVLLSWYLFIGNHYRRGKDTTPVTDTETVAPADDSVPASAPAQSDMEGEAPADTPEEIAAPEESAAPQENVDVSGAKLNREDFTLSVKGETYTVKLSGTEAMPRWSIDNPNVATITGDGTVTAVANGNTTIHCKVGSRDLTCTVRVRGTGTFAAEADAPMIAEPITPVAPPQPASTPASTPASSVDVSGAKLNREDFTLSRGEKFTMKVSGTEATPQWDIDNPNVAVITEDGAVTGVGAGTTTIHCKVGTRDLTCIVRVQ